MEQLIGFAGIPFVRLAVKQLGLTKWWALLASQVLAIVLNVVIAAISKQDLMYGALMGVLVGLMSNFYNDIKSS